jgi:hypothetical protein
VSVPNQDLDFQRHMSLSAYVKWVQLRLFVLLVLVELMTITFYITFITHFVNRSDGIVHAVYLNFSKIIKHWHTAYRIILLCKTVVTCSTITEYLCYRWPPVYSACRMLISSFFAPHSGFITEYVYHRIYNKQHEVRTMPLMERELLIIHRAPASSHWQTLSHERGSNSHI